MKTPIVDFVKNYNKKRFARFHMPGHKGKKILGCEPFDITEILGADILYSPNGIIELSERNATALFNTEHTYYSTEGATLCIKAMLYLALKNGKDKTVIAGRNAHKSFINACALLDLNVEWIMPETNSIYSCLVTPEKLASTIKNSKQKPFAVYLTSPDYLGNILDVKPLAEVCNNEHIPLLIDNAHGAYSAFTNPCFHPIKLGVTMCVDSAHKTLPVLTGGAYLHIAKGKTHLTKSARESLSLFASTSPSYLILQSLDFANAYLEKNAVKYNGLIDKINTLKLELANNGYPVLSGEPLKIVIDANKIGYTGHQLANLLRKNKIEPEMADARFIVFMISLSTSKKDLSRLKKAILKVKINKPIQKNLFTLSALNPKTSIRQAVTSNSVQVQVENAIGKIASEVHTVCPPAIPIVIPGEQITEQTVNLLKEEGINTIKVIE